MQVISAQFSPVERQKRIAALGDGIDVECIGGIHVVRRYGMKIGVGFSLDVAIADAESNMETWTQKEAAGKKVGKARLGTIVCRKTA